MAAARELERCAAMGARAFCFSELPHELGLPSIHSGYWDPVFSVASEAEVVLCTHLGSSSNMLDMAPDAPRVSNSILHPVNLIRTFVDWIFSGKFSQFPGLKIALSEGGIGWMPYMLASAELYVKFGDRIPSATEVERRPRRIDPTPPREVFRDHIFGCFITDDHGVRCIDEIGVDNVMIETDFPHASSEWPNSWTIAQGALGHLSDQDRFKVIQGNACRVFRFEPHHEGMSGARP
jgi:predicted TIM-barrel fold metal-dependent hydrolase